METARERELEARCVSLPQALEWFFSAVSTLQLNARLNALAEMCKMQVLLAWIYKKRSLFYGGRGICQGDSRKLSDFFRNMILESVKQRDIVFCQH